MCIRDSTKINMVPMYVVMGVAQGIMPLISYNYASGNIPRMKKAFFFTARIGVTISALASAFLFACADGLVAVSYTHLE